MRLIDVLKQTGDSLRMRRRPALLISVFFFILPDLCANFWLDQQGKNAAQELVLRFDQTKATASFLELLEPALEYLRLMVPAVLGTGVASLIGYLALVQLAVGRVRLEAAPSLAALLGAAWRSFFPRGLLLALLFGIALIIGQALVLPGLFVAVLGIMAPVIMIAEGKGAWRSLWDALSLRYANREPGAIWAHLANLMYLCGLFYLAELAAVMLGERLLLARIEGSLPFVPLANEAKPADFYYFIVTVATSLLEQCMLVVLPFATVVVYFGSASKRKLADA